MTTLQIPFAADEAARQVFNDTVVGTLDNRPEGDGSFQCLTCNPLENGLFSAKVYGVNIAPYSLVCHKCGGLVIDGVKKGDKSGPLCMFPPEGE